MACGGAGRAGGEYSLSPSAIGARYGNILSPSMIGARYGNRRQPPVHTGALRRHGCRLCAGDHQRQRLRAAALPARSQLQHLRRLRPRGGARTRPKSQIIM
eukprot:1195985-Prorocentrum_minimum.AAC.2